MTTVFMIWLPFDQLKEIGVSRGILHRNRSRWTWRQTGRRGKNGKVIEEVLLESMGKEFQKKWLETRGSDAASERVSDPDTNTAVDSPMAADVLGTEIRQKAGAEDRLTQALVRLRPEERDAFMVEAQRRASIVEKYDAVNPKRRRGEGERAGRWDYVDAVLDLCGAARCTCPIVLSVEPSRGKAISPHTLEKWSRDFRVDGLAAFLRKPPERRSEVDNRLAMIDPRAAEWVEKNWRKTPSSKKLFQKVMREAARHGWSPIPSYGWFYHRYKDLPNIVKTLAFEGQKAYTGKHAPFVPRDYRDLEALQILVGDHSVRDVTVMLPDGSLTRPWLTLWQDMRTGLIWGWHLDLTPSSVTIGLAYANGVKNFGAQPLTNRETGYQSYLYTDQGKDYRCKQLTGQTLEFRDQLFSKAARIEGGLGHLCTERRVGLMDELDIKHIMARGYNAREKPVERTHRDISAWEQNTFEAEYCGKDTSHRPERWRDAYARHHRLLKKTGKNLNWVLSESPFMTLEDYREALSGWITEYNASEHTRATLGGATVVPVREYERLYTTRYEISDDALALLLMKAARRKIGKNGVQFFQPHWYFLHESMSMFKGDEIEIRYTDGDWERVWAVLPDNTVVEASAVGNSGVLNRNKKTMGIVAKQRNHEMKVVRDFRFIQESNHRGETTEDRVAAQLIDAGELPEPEQQKMAVNAGPTVHNFNRFDGKIKRSSQPQVTAEQIENANVITGMFRSEDSAPRIVEEWEIDDGGE